MCRKKQFIHLFLMAGLLLATMIACDKSDDLDGDNQSAGKIKDVDGNVYKTVTIGSQVWMVENLKTTKYNDGTKIPNVTDKSEWMNLTTDAYCNYDNQESNAATYGRLYNWYAVNTGKLAPGGWHVATYEDWGALLDYVKANTGSSGSEAKALAATINWASSNDDGAIGNDLAKNNSTGFSALPGGERSSDGAGIPFGIFYDIGKYGKWWCSKVYYEDYDVSGFGRVELYYDDGDAKLEGYYYFDNYDYGFLIDGYSVRCVKDN